MQAAAGRASAMMKTLGHSGRLMILCNLAEGERAVGELADDLGMSQSALSQHLMRMRSEGLVETRREAQTVFYRLTEGEVRQVIQSLYTIFCPS
ncbi:MAG: metalloregulator ArsR/SmtB family transcription factor [Gammaproteobacteria bacterium]|nr:metalloregulator ArsR/SmtB family transcription factor [Gammaproteobacteria bacterium]